MSCQDGVRRHKSPVNKLLIGDLDSLGPSNADDIEDLLEIGCAESTGHIPSLCRVESGPIATKTATVDNVCKPREALLVQPGIQPAHGGLALGDARVVDEREDTRHSWRRGAGAVERMDGAVDPGKVPISLRGEVRVCAAGGVVQPGGLVPYRVEVPLHRDFLPQWAGEVVAES